MSRLMARPLLTWSLITLALAVVILVPILTIANCGGGGDARKLLEETSNAVSGMNTYHMTVSSYGQSEELGKVQAEELSADIDGENIHIKDTVFDQTGNTQATQEIIQLDGKQYTKDINSDAWSVGDATINQQDLSAYTNNISDFLMKSGSGKTLGEEEANGVLARHLVYTLSSAQVSSLAGGSSQDSTSQSSSTNFNFNEGGQVDIWIDPSTHFPARYEMVFKHIWVSQTSYADVQYVVDISAVNEPINMVAPI
jgi:LppX_LprAFG lipoprotein